MEVVRNYKFRLYPRAGKLKRLLNTLETCRLTYNRVLSERIQAYKVAQKPLGLYACMGLVKSWGIEGVHSQVLQNVCTRVELAYQAFFRRLKAKGGKAGFPRFRGTDRYDSFTFPQSGFKLENGRLKLSKIGHVKILEHKPIQGKVKTCTIKKEGSHWYAILSCIVNIVPEVQTGLNPTGIDVGCTDFAVLSTGKAIKNPHFLRQSEDSLKSIQQAFSKLKHLSKDNKKKQKVKQKLQKIHQKAKNQRRDFLHQLSRKLVRKYSHICVEKLNVKGMLNKNDTRTSLNKSISDSGWATFRSFLNYKAVEAGSLVIEVNPKGTSKTCSRCGSQKDMPLSERVYSCPVCGLKLGRDLNASYNILRIGLDSLIRSERAKHQEAVML